MERLKRWIGQGGEDKMAHNKGRAIWLVLAVALFPFVRVAQAQIPIKVVAQEVNLRSTPEVNNTNLIGRVVKGQQFVAVEKRNDTTYGAWYKIAIPSTNGAAYGWVAQKNKSGTTLTQEDSSLSSKIVTIVNDRGVGWRLSYFHAVYDNWLKDKNGQSLKVWNGQKFIYRNNYPNNQTRDGCAWWEIFIPYLKDSQDWGYEDYLALFVRDDAVRAAGNLEGYVTNESGQGIAGATVKAELKNGHSDP
jgi:hypothetical protein